jgi:hypothetical protein
VTGNSTSTTVSTTSSVYVQFESTFAGCRTDRVLFFAGLYLMSRLPAHRAPPFLGAQLRLPSPEVVLAVQLPPLMRRFPSQQDQKESLREYWEASWSLCCSHVEQDHDFDWSASLESQSFWIYYGRDSDA